MSNQKARLDIVMAAQGLAESREKAKAIIMSGIVYIDNQKCDKPGQQVTEDAPIEVRGDTLKYVSRGGLKLEKAINEFNIDLTERACMDVGASTGGFTDCMLQNGAKTVYSVDVGYGQLAWKLRTDPRVVNLERTNIRYVDSGIIKHTLDFVSVDVSFISLKLIIPVIYKLMNTGAETVCLIKPQFEAGREKVGKKGVVRDRGVHLEVVTKIIEFAKAAGLAPVGLSFSPIKGPEGNIEYLMYAKKDGIYTITDEIINEIINKSHSEL